METRNTTQETRNTGEPSEENEQRIALTIGWQRATRRNGLVTTRDGLSLLTGIPKHGVSWKGDYIDEGLFAGPKRVEGTVRMQNQPALSSFLSFNAGMEKSVL